MKITIAGRGIWGHALGSLLSENNHLFTYWDKISRIDSDIVVLALPAEGIRSVMHSLADASDLVVVNTSKGIEQSTHKLPYEIVSEKKIFHYVSLLGPSFAQEVLSHMPTSVNLGYIDKKNAIIIQKLFQTEYFRITCVRGVEAIEVAAALKNIYAILLGILDGLGFGANTKTHMITLAYEETLMIITLLGYDVDRKAQSGILGDLLLTCTNTTSRNFTFGKYLVTYPVDISLQRTGGTVEGWSSLESIQYLTQKVNKRVLLVELLKIMKTHSKKSADMRNVFLQYVHHA